MALEDFYTTRSLDSVISQVKQAKGMSAGTSLKPDSDLRSCKILTDLKTASQKIIYNYIMQRKAAYLHIRKS